MLKMLPILDREGMRANARTLRERLGVATSDPIDVGAAARLLGCRIAEKRLANPHLQAALVPGDTGFVIWLLKGDAEQPLPHVTPRHRFLVLHELAHTVFYSRNSKPHRRFSPPRNDEEFLCDVFAAEAMVPAGAHHSIEAAAAAFNAPPAVVEWVQNEEFDLERWRRSIDSCSGPGW